MTARLFGKRTMVRLADGLRRRAPAGSVRCLLYHSVVADDVRDRGQMTTPVSLFDEQMTYLSEHQYHVLQPEEVLRRWTAGEAIPPRTISLTFDDGFADNLTLALPVLERYGFAATIFLVASRRPERAEYLTLDQIREMRSSRLIRFGCHSASHRRLRGLTGSELHAEILEARHLLEDRLETAVSVFAYPFGSYGSWDAATLRVVRRAGFLGAFTSVFGVNTVDSDRCLLRRSRVSWADRRLPDFRRLLAGAYDWYAWVQRLQFAGVADS